MHLPGFMQFTPEERRAVLAILLFTGGGGLLLEVGRRHPHWVPGLLSARGRRSVAAESTARARTAAGGKMAPDPAQRAAFPGGTGDTGASGPARAGAAESSWAGSPSPPDAPGPTTPPRAVASLLPEAGEVARGVEPRGAPGDPPGDAGALSGNAPGDDAGRAPPASARKRSFPAAPGGTPVDLNRAGLEELCTLPGIGPRLAQRIIEDRATGGPFRSLDDLARVRGIGRATVARLRGLAVAG